MFKGTVGGCGGSEHDERERCTARDVKEEGTYPRKGRRSRERERQDISPLSGTSRGCTRDSRRRDTMEKGELVTSSWCIAARASPPLLKWGNIIHVCVRGQDKKSFGDQGIFSFEQTIKRDDRRNDRGEEQEKNSGLPCLRESRVREPARDRMIRRVRSGDPRERLATGSSRSWLVAGLLSPSRRPLVALSSPSRGSSSIGGSLVGTSDW